MTEPTIIQTAVGAITRARLGAEAEQIEKAAADHLAKRHRIRWALRRVGGDRAVIAFGRAPRLDYPVAPSATVTCCPACGAPIWITFAGYSGPYFGSAYARRGSA